MVADKYKDFQELSSAEIRDVDYKIEVQDRQTEVAVIAIHGGEIEPDTETVVKAVAGPNLSYYTFLGNSEDQHITSIHFDEPQCLDLITKSRTVISIHGKSGPGEFVMLGGRDTKLIAKTTKALTEDGFEVKILSSDVAGIGRVNVCNRGTSGKGLQIEMSRDLRKTLIRDRHRMAVFAQSIRKALQ